MAFELSKKSHIAFICGHYEGVDARVIEEIGAEEVSLGDYVLTGGELAAAVMIDVITRLLPAIAAGLGLPTAIPVVGGPFDVVASDLGVVMWATVRSSGFFASASTQGC